MLVHLSLTVLIKKVLIKKKSVWEVLGGSLDRRVLFKDFSVV